MLRPLALAARSLRPLALAARSLASKSKPPVHKVLDALKDRKANHVDPWEAKFDEDTGELRWRNAKTGEETKTSEKPVSSHKSLAINLGFGAFTFGAVVIGAKLMGVI